MKDGAIKYEVIQGVRDPGTGAGPGAGGIERRNKAGSAAAG